MRNSNLLWGLFFILAAVVVVINQLGYFYAPSIGVISIIIAILMVPIIIKSIASLNFWGVFFPLAVLAIIFVEPLGIAEFSYANILLIALFASIGFSLIFKRKSSGASNMSKGHWKYKKEKVSERSSENEMSFGVNFFGHKYKEINSQELKSVEITSNFGEIEAYFDEANLSADGAEINLSVSFSEVELYVPKTWNVQNEANCVFGEIKEKKRKNKEASESPKVVLTGNVNFSEVYIIYV